MDIRIQKNPPKPTQSFFSDATLAKYPFATLKVGESFLFDDDVGPHAYRMARNASKGGKVFRAHRAGYRAKCWRVR